MPERRSESAMSRTTAWRVTAEILTVPGQAACSCEQAMVSGGRRCTEYAAATSRAMVQAMTVSVASGRKGPCCSKLPMGRTATPGRRALTSSVVSSGNKPGVVSCVPEPVMVLRPFVP
jgi:hypothetical protein